MNFELWYLCWLGLGLLFIMLLLSPFEALGWWAGWSQREVKITTPQPEADQIAPAVRGPFFVYLTGIGGFSGDYLARREVGLLDLLEEQFPGAVTVRDVFPFSATNNPLNGERQLSSLWNWLHTRRLKVPNNVFDVLIAIRNLTHVAVSADPRYGPLNNVGVAREVARSLVRHGYPAGSGLPVYLIGYSGGGQVAVGLSPFLNQALAAPVTIFSLGGVISDDPGIAGVHHLYHLHGSKELVDPLGKLLFPGRWPILPHSAWNQARRDGRITVIDLPGFTHFGSSDYFSWKAKTDEGKSHQQQVAEIISQRVPEEAS